MSAEHVKVITTNRRARFDYHVESKLECGIALTGTEVKSLRDEQRAALRRVRHSQGRRALALQRADPALQAGGAALEPRPEAPRKLLLHRREIDKLQERSRRPDMR